MAATIRAALLATWATVVTRTELRTQIPTEPGGSGGHTSGEGTVEGLIKKSKKIKQSVIESIELKYNTTGIVCLL